MKYMYTCHDIFIIFLPQNFPRYLNAPLFVYALNLYSYSGANITVLYALFNHGLHKLKTALIQSQHCICGTTALI